MKSLLVTALLIALYTAECFTFSNGDDGALITDSSQSLPVGTEDPDQVRYSEDELDTNNDVDIEEERNYLTAVERKGKKNDALNQISKDLGFLKNNITSTINNAYKTNTELKKEVASLKLNLANQGCPKGLFYYAPSDQCFLLLNDTTRTWYQAASACPSKGLVLAHPYDPVGITKYIITKYGDHTYTWIGAKGTGSYVKFQRSNKYIGSSNPLWYERSGSTSNCLALTTRASMWKSYGRRVYYMLSCTYKYWTLCELLKE